MYLDEPLSPHGLEVQRQNPMDTGLPRNGTCWRTVLTETGVSLERESQGLERKTLR